MEVKVLPIRSFRAAEVAVELPFVRLLPGMRRFGHYQANGRKLETEHPSVRCQYWLQMSSIASEAELVMGHRPLVLNLELLGLPEPVPGRTEALLVLDFAAFAIHSVAVDSVVVVVAAAAVLVVFASLIAD